MNNELLHKIGEIGGVDTRTETVDGISQQTAINISQHFLDNLDATRVLSPEEKDVSILWAANCIAKDPQEGYDITTVIDKIKSHDFSQSVILNGELLDEFYQLFEGKGEEDFQNKFKDLKAAQYDFKSLKEFFKYNQNNPILQDRIVYCLDQYAKVRDLNSKIESLTGYIENLKGRIDSLGDLAKNVIEKNKLEGYKQTAFNKREALQTQYYTLLDEMGFNPDKRLELKFSLRKNDKGAIILQKLYNYGKFETIATLMKTQGNLADKDFIKDEEGKNKTLHTKGEKFVANLVAFQERPNNINSLMAILKDLTPKAASIIFVYYLSNLNLTLTDELNLIHSSLAIKKSGATKEELAKQEFISAIFREFDEYDLYAIISDLQTKTKDIGKSEEEVAAIENLQRKFMQRVLIAKEPELIKGAVKVGGIAAGAVGGLSLIAITVYCIANHTEFAKQFMSVMVNVITFSGVNEALKDAIITAMPNISQDLAAAIAASIGILPTVLLATGVAFAAGAGIKYMVDTFNSPELDLLKNEIKKIAVEEKVPER